MSDVMLLGILMMPYDMAMSGEISRHQYHSSGKEAAERIQADAAELSRLRAEVERLRGVLRKRTEEADRADERADKAEAALSDERAHADAMEGALTALIEGGNRQLALIGRRVKVTDPMTLIVTKGQMLAAIEARAAHRARRQG